MKARADTTLILGVSGQDGAYLANILLKRGLKVHGTSRDKEISTFANLRSLGIYDSITLHSLVVSDFRGVLDVLKLVAPRYIFNLAAQSSVELSFEQPVETIDSIIHGTINVLEPCVFSDSTRACTTPVPASASATPAARIPPTN